MDAKKLMLGDYVYLEYSKQNVKVSAIGQQHISAWGVEGLIYEKDILPIPFTKDTFSKFGWNSYIDEEANEVRCNLKDTEGMCRIVWSSKFRSIDIEYHVTVFGKFDVCTRKVVMPCDYIHEFQQALRKAGITKSEISL